MNRHKFEEQRRKDEEEEERTKEVLQEFVETFEREELKLGKTFVRGDVFQAGVSKGEGEQRSSKANSLYRPASIVSKKSQELQSARLMAEQRARKFSNDSSKSRPKKPGKNTESKRMSNLEAFKEELKRVQEERAERKRIRVQMQEGGLAEGELTELGPELDDLYGGSDYDSDPNSTNLFISNLSLDVIDKELCTLFGAYGPLASYKLLHPRIDDDRPKTSMTAFVAYMTRKDAERALMGLNGKRHFGFDLKISWAKPVPIPFYPSYIPDVMLDLISVPPYSGLPFNAQPTKEDWEAYKWPLPESGPPETEDPEEIKAYEKPKLAEKMDKDKFIVFAPLPNARISYGLFLSYTLYKTKWHAFDSKIA